MTMIMMDDDDVFNIDSSPLLLTLVVALMDHKQSFVPD